MTETASGGRRVPHVGEIPSARGRAIDLADLIRARPADPPGHFTVDVPDGLQQGRGAWGAVATGTMTSAAAQVVGRADQVVRSMSAQLVAPLLPGRAEVRTEILREGSAITTVEARVLTEGELVAHGVVVLGSARVGQQMPDQASLGSASPPAELAAGPYGLPVLPAGPPAPECVNQLELWPTAGLPFSGCAGNETSGWLQPIAPVSAVDAALLVALADTWWVAVMARMNRPRPAATVGFTCEVTGDPATVQVGPDGRLEPLYHRGRLIAGREGYSVETRELWTAAGQLLTWNTQTVVVIK